MKKILILLAVISFSCKQNAEQTAEQATEQPPVEESDFMSTDHAMVNVTLSDTSQYYLLQPPCAVVVFPDSTWGANEQKKMSEEEWNTIIDDNSYYTSMAIDTLRGSNVAVHMDLNKKRYLVFKGVNTSFTLDNEKLRETWALILFNGTDAPVEWSGTDIYAAMDSIYH